MSASQNQGRPPKVLAISSPKGGVGKTTTAVNLAHLAALEGYRTFLVDADPNRSATEWVESAGERMTFEVEAVEKVQEGSLAMLRELQGFDLVLVDLPAARRSHRRGTCCGEGPAACPPSMR
ncbi:ParA family protein [Pseudonocardia sp. ICBG1142]|uniref:ParA family protein n=1 Tax=Pseudonocardia sp. ICBG1142 TaxID=2846760 RepID=UPI001CF6EAB4|nr:ParA family protein [Pseudonocardia sp. ICBG1142]